MIVDKPYASAIDVIIPVYNCEKYVERAIRSVLVQSQPPRKIIVVDDGSTDNSGKIVLALEKESREKIKYLRKENGGLSSARNAGIKTCESDLVAFLDSDDEWRSDKLEKQIEVFQQSSFENLGVVYCGCEIIDGTGSVVTTYPVVQPRNHIRGMVFEKLLNANLVTSSGSGVLVKRSCFESVGLFDEDLSAAEDWDMWLRIAKEYAFDFVPEKIVLIRRHPGNMQNDRLHMLNNEARFMDKWAKLLKEEYPAAIRKWRKTLCNEMIGGLANPGLSSMVEPISWEGRRILFSSTFGSIRLYVALKLLQRNIFGLVRDFRERAKVIIRGIGWLLTR